MLGGSRQAHNSPAENSPHSPLAIRILELTPFRPGLGKGGHQTQQEHPARGGELPLGDLSWLQALFAVVRTGFRAAPSFSRNGSLPGDVDVAASSRRIPLLFAGLFGLCGCWLAGMAGRVVGWEDCQPGRAPVIRKPKPLAPHPASIPVGRPVGRSSQAFSSTDFRKFFPILSVVFCLQVLFLPLLFSR